MPRRSGRRRTGTHSPRGPARPSGAPVRSTPVIWLNFARAGFMLAQIDGTPTFEDLFSVSAMSRLDTARIPAQLLDQRVIVS